MLKPLCGDAEPASAAAASADTRPSLPASSERAPTTTAATSHCDAPPKSELRRAPDAVQLSSQTRPDESGEREPCGSTTAAERSPPAAGSRAIPPPAPSPPRSSDAAGSSLPSGTGEERRPPPQTVISAETRRLIDDLRSRYSLPVVLHDGTTPLFEDDDVNDRTASPPSDDRTRQSAQCETRTTTSAPSPPACSLKFDVSGQPRTSPVHVPAYLQKTARPGATPNTKFTEVEDPVRRKLNNMAWTGATTRGCETMRRMRGLSVLPLQLDFGVLKEGCTYNFTVSLQNTGIDACRFRVRQPPPSTGIRVLYKPGPVAAGMKTDLTVELYAIAAGVRGDRGVGQISHDLQITTETDQLLVPISARVLTASEYDNRGTNSPQGGRSAGVRLVSTKPPVGLGGIIQHHKNNDSGSGGKHTDYLAVHG